MYTSNGISFCMYICVATEHGRKKKQKKSGHKKGKGDKLGQHAESQASLVSDEGNSAADVNVSLLTSTCLALCHN